MAASPSIDGAPRASVVIPCHDAAGTIGLQLEGLTRQRGAPSFEVVLVDNRSTDDLAGAVEPYRARLQLRLVTAERLASPGYARNAGVAASVGEVLLFCDADDFVSSDWVARGVTALEVCGIVNGGATPVDPRDVARGADHLQDLLDGEGEPGAVQVPDRPEDYPILLGGSCAFRREVYLALGGYDAGMPYGVEDNDLALRAQAAGHVIGRAPGMRLAYRSRSDAEQTIRRAFSAGERHMLLAHRHGLFGISPSLGRGWFLEFPRTALSGLRMVGQPSRRDWRNLARRAALATGQLVGHVRYGVLGRLPPRRIGDGLDG